MATRSDAEALEATVTDAMRDHEFGRGWPILIGAVIGIALGVASIPAPATGILMNALEREQGWSRGAISFGPTILYFGSALLSPLVGWLSDRVRPAWLCGSGLAGLAASLFILSRTNADIRMYYAVWGLMAVVSMGCTTTPYARALSAAFQRHRGLALGLGMVGSGIAGMILPTWLVPYAAAAGWRQGFETLALTIAIAIIPVCLLLARAPAPRAFIGSAEIVADGLTFQEAIRRRPFWIMAFCFGAITISVGGLHLHLVAFLGDAGVPAAKAGRIAAISGLAVLGARILAGWLFDRIFAPWVAAVSLGMAAAFILSLAIVGAPAAPLGAVAIGLTVGTEFDLMAYLTARYFGLRAYGRLYGLFYLLVLLGAGSSSYIYGAVHDRFASYTPAFVTAAALLALCAILFLTLPRFPSEEAR
jgi:hypothetical protein